MDPRAYLEAAGHAGDVGVRRLVAEVVAYADVFAVARLLIDLLHHARAGCRDRRAEGSRVTPPFLEAPTPQVRIPPPAETVAEAVVGYRLAHQGSGDGMAVGVIVVGAPVLGRREAGVAGGGAIERERGECQFGLSLRVRTVQEFGRVGRRDRGLKIHILGAEPYDVADQRRR